MSCKSFIQHLFNSENNSYILLLTAYNVYYMQLDFFMEKVSLLNLYIFARFKKNRIRLKRIRFRVNYSSLFHFLGERRFLDEYTGSKKSIELLRR